MARRVMTNFTAGTTSPVKAKKLAAKEEVPSGTVKEVLKWAGDNQDRAERALAAEKASSDPRTSVIEGLKKVLSADEG